MGSFGKYSFLCSVTVEALDRKRRSDEATKGMGEEGLRATEEEARSDEGEGGGRLGRDQPALGTGIEATAGESRHGYAAGNIAFATKGIGSIVMPPAPPAGFTRPAEFDIS